MGRRSATLTGRPERPAAGPVVSGDLLEAMPVAVIAADRNGRITHWNRRAEELFGWPAAQVVGREGVQLLTFATDRRRAAEIMAQIRAGDRWEGELTVRRPGRTRVSAFVSTAPSLDRDGQLVGAIAVAVDISARVEAERERADALGREQAARAEAELLHRIATAASGEADLTGILSAALDRLARLIRFTGGSIALIEGDELVLKAAVGPFAGRSIEQRLPRGSGQSWHIIDSREAWLCDDLLEAGYHIRGIPEPEGPRSYLGVPLVWREESVGLLQIDSTEPAAFSADDQQLLEAVAVALSGPIEVARRHAAEREALAASEAAQSRLRLLAEASDVLASSLDYPATLAAVARLAIPLLADYCLIDLLEDGELRQVAVAHVDPRQEGALRELRQRYPHDPDGPLGVAQVLRTGEPQLRNAIDGSWLDQAARDGEHRSRMEKLGVGAYMVVPLVARGRLMGAFSFVSLDPGRRYEQSDLALAQDLARRAAIAVDISRLYGELSNFRSTVDLTHDGVFMLDPETLRYFYVNQGAADLTGYEREEMLGMTPLDLKPGFDEERFRATLRPLLAGASESTVVTTSQRRKDGRLISVEMLIQYVAPEGERGRLVMVVRDISDRIEARVRLQRLAEAERARNAELRAIIRAMGDAVLVVQPQGVITMSNPAAEAVFGEGALSHYDEVLAQLDDPDGLAPIVGQEARYGPVEIRLSAPEDRWLEISAYPVFAAAEAVGETTEPGVLETILFMRDVTEARRARAMSDAFVGVLSHELRTPVTTIYGNSKLLGRTVRELDDSVKRSVLGDIEVESERLYRLVEDLLVLARFGEGAAHLGREPLLLQRIVPLVIRSEEARWPGTIFQTQISPGLPTVQGEPTYVEQVVRNLIGNAAKYSGEGGKVEIVLDAEDDEVRLRVLDNGPGFAPAEAARLFELFYRSAATATKAGGAGIGLFVSQRLIESMGGRIWARPRSGGGAEFGFTLKVFNEEGE
jgi:PAS domain S-box-containing protein